MYKPKSNRKLEKAFGFDELGYTDIPPRFSNVAYSRILNHIDRGGCSYCFPHGYETTNARWYKIQRSWKEHRKTQWKDR